MLHTTSSSSDSPAGRSFSVLPSTPPQSPGARLGSPTLGPLQPRGKPVAGRSREGLLRLLLPRAPPVRAAAAAAEGAGGVSASAAPLAAPLLRARGAGPRSRRWARAGGGPAAARLRSRRSLAPRPPPSPAPARPPAPRLTLPATPPPLRRSPGWSVSGGIRRRGAPRPFLFVPDQQRPRRRRGLSGSPERRGGRCWGGLWRDRAAARSLGSGPPRRPPPGAALPPPRRIPEGSAASAPGFCARPLLPAGPRGAPPRRPEEQLSSQPLQCPYLFFSFLFPHLCLPSPGRLGSFGWALRQGKRLGSPRRRLLPPPPCGGGRGSRLGGHRSG